MVNDEKEFAIEISILKYKSSRNKGVKKLSYKVKLKIEKCFSLNKPTPIARKFEALETSTPTTISPSLANGLTLA